MATFADLAGIEPPTDIDGLSITPTLFQKGEQEQHRYLYWEWDRYDWGKRDLVPGGRMAAVREGDWKAVRMQENAKLELYNLAEDIGEQNDLAEQRPQIATRLAGYMTEAHVDMRPQEKPSESTAAHSVDRTVPLVGTVVERSPGVGERPWAGGRGRVSSPGQIVSRTTWRCSYA